jgi:hypothetical protein
VTKLNKGDLVRARERHRRGAGAKALVLYNFPQPEIRSVRVLWLSGEWGGKTTWENRMSLRKIEVEGD